MSRRALASLRHDALKIVRAIVTLGRSLGMQVLGEGVETPAQLAALGRLGCHLAQGFLLSPPLPADEAEALLRGGRLDLAGG